MDSPFGKYAVISEVTHTLSEEPGWWWKIKPVTSGMELEMSKFLSHRRLVTTPSGRVEMPPTSLEIGFHELALSFGGTNIPKFADKPVEEGGEPIIAKDATIEQIEEVLKSFPRSLFMELWRAVGEAYPFWGPLDPNQA